MIVWHMFLKLEKGQVDIFQVGRLLAACNYKQHVIYLTC